MTETKGDHQGFRDPWNKRMAEVFCSEGGSANISLESLPMIEFPLLQEFLRNDNSQTQILVGAKGTGKSLALAVKASLVKSREASKKLFVIPQYFPFMWRLSAGQLTVPKKNISHYCEAPTWLSIWKLVLSSVFCLHLHRRTSNEISGKDTHLKTFGEVLDCPKGSNERVFFDFVGELYSEHGKTRADILTPIIGEILTRQVDSQGVEKWFNSYLLRHINSRHDGNKTYIFVDQIDEAAKALVSELNPDQGAKLWYAIQIGLIDAASELADQGTRCYVYSAVRTEAYEHYSYMGIRGLAKIADDFCITMEYTNEQLHQIFEDNVRRTEASELANTNGSTANKFFGVEHFDHPYVLGDSEDPVSWVVRHSFGIPRELVWHGGNILRNIPSSKRNDRTVVSSFVNKLGAKIFEDYITFLVPQWDDTVELVFKQIKHNVIPSQLAYEIDAKFAQPYNGVRPILYMYQRGLIGAPIANPAKRNTYLQNFLPPGTHHSVVELPASDMYILHPCMNEKVKSKLLPEEAGQFVTPWFIAGHGKECPGSLQMIKLVITLDQYDDNINVYYLENGVEQSHFQDLDSYLVQGLRDRSKPATAMFLSIITTMKLSGQVRLKTSMIIDVSRRLARNKVLSNKYVGCPAEDYIADQFRKWSAQEPECVKKLKKVLGQEFFKNISIKSKGNAITKERETLTVKGILPENILLNINLDEG